MFRTILGGALLAGAFAANPAALAQVAPFHVAASLAGEQAEPPSTLAARPFQSFSRSVRYDDLDLSHASDANVLLARIEQSAHRVCVQVTRSTGSMKRCRREAVADAVDLIGAEQLVVAHAKAAGARLRLASR